MCWCSVVVSVTVLVKKVMSFLDVAMFVVFVTVLIKKVMSFPDVAMWFL